MKIKFLLDEEKLTEITELKKSLPRRKRKRRKKRRFRKEAGNAKKAE